MAIKIFQIHHAALVVRNAAVSERFYVGILGLERHHKSGSWLLLNDSATLHLIEIPEAEVDESLYHEVGHVALQVEDLRAVVTAIFKQGHQPFQMDFQGVERPIDGPEDSITYGIGTVFARDPDGNLVEFVQEGVGIFASQ